MTVFFPRTITNTPSDETLTDLNYYTTEANDNTTPTTKATIPHIKGISENISRILQPFNIRVTHKPITTLRQLLTNVEDQDEPRKRQGPVYKINCSDWHASYISETGRNLKTRLTEHKRATRKGDVNNHIAEQHRLSTTVLLRTTLTRTIKLHYYEKFSLGH